MSWLSQPEICEACGHEWDMHTPQHDKEMATIGLKFCRAVVKVDEIDFMDEFGIVEMNHLCSCYGVPLEEARRLAKKFKVGIYKK